MIRSMTRAALICGLLCSSLILYFRDGYTQTAPFMSARDAANEESAEAAECAIYDAFAATCLEKSDRQDIAGRADKAGQTALQISNIAGKLAGVMDEALNARLNLIRKEMMESVDNNCVNISKLTIKYADSCQTLVEHPEDRLKALTSGSQP